MKYSQSFLMCINSGHKYGDQKYLIVKGLNKEEITRLNLDRFCDVMQRLLFLHPLLLLVLKTFIWVFAPTTIPGDKLE